MSRDLTNERRGGDSPTTGTQSKASLPAASPLNQEPQHTPPLSEAPPRAFQPAPERSAPLYGSATAALMAVVAEDTEAGTITIEGDASPQEEHPKSGYRGLPSRNVVIDKKRTSIRLDAHSLESLSDIAFRERVTVNELCTKINERNQGNVFTFTAALRIFMLSYFRQAATEEGHRLAGHGQGRPLTGTPFETESDIIPMNQSPEPPIGRTRGGGRVQPTRATPRPKSPPNPRRGDDTSASSMPLTCSPDVRSGTIQKSRGPQ